MVAEYLTVLGGLIALTNLTVEVFKQFIPNEKFPTNLLAVIVAMVLTLIGFFMYVSAKEIVMQWYYIAGAVVIGILVAYGAMFGYDKLKEILDKFKE